VLLSVNAEGIFYCLIFAVLQTWAEIEATLRQYAPVSQVKAERTYQPLCMDDIRVALFYLFFVHGLYFGMGKSVLCQLHSSWCTFANCQ
jgi:GPI ethanolamine phosphate transferase 1